jgi:hypothetical protein
MMSSSFVQHQKPTARRACLIKIQSTGEKCDLIESFFHRDDGLVLGAEV